MAKQSTQKAEKSETDKSWASLLQSVISDKKSLQDYIDEGWMTSEKIQKAWGVGKRTTIIQLKNLVDTGKIKKIDVRCHNGERFARKVFYKIL